MGSLEKQRTGMLQTEISLPICINSNLSEIHSQSPTISNPKLVNLNLSLIVKIPISY